jgi:hypothetical protein
VKKKKEKKRRPGSRLLLCTPPPHNRSHTNTQFKKNKEPSVGRDRRCANLPTGRWPVCVARISPDARSRKIDQCQCCAKLPNVLRNGSVGVTRRNRALPAAIALLFCRKSNSNCRRHCCGHRLLTAIRLGSKLSIIWSKALLSRLATLSGICGVRSRPSGCLIPSGPTLTARIRHCLCLPAHKCC